jgi:ribonuclease HI
VDARSFQQSLDGAIVVVARDDRGHFIAAATWVLPYVSSTDSVEILAIKHGLYLAARIGCNVAHIESDSSFAVETMQKQEDYYGEEVATIAECNQLVCDFAKVSFPVTTRDRRSRCFPCFS